MKDVVFFLSFQPLVICKTIIKVSDFQVTLEEKHSKEVFLELKEINLIKTKTKRRISVKGLTIPLEVVFSEYLTNYFSFQPAITYRD